MSHPPDLDARITELWDEIPDATGTHRADLLLELADHLLHTERHSEALPVVDMAEELYLDAEHHRLAGRAAHIRGIVLGHLDRPDERLDAERASIAHYDQAQRRDLAGCSRMSLGFHLRSEGNLEEALPVFQAALADFTAANELMHQGNAYMAVLEALIDLGRFPSAHRLLRPTLASLATTAPVPAVAFFHERAADVLEVRRGHAEAARSLRKARAVWEALDESEAVARCDIRLATLDLGLGNAETAYTALVQLREERKDAGDVAGVAASDRGLGLVALARRRPAQARRHLESASAIFEASGLLADAAECEALAAEAALALTSPAAALSALVALAAVLRRFHRPKAELRAHLVLAGAHLEHAPAGSGAAAAHAKRAATIARRGRFDDELDRSRRLRAAAEARTS